MKYTSPPWKLSHGGAVTREWNGVNWPIIQVHGLGDTRLPWHENTDKSHEEAYATAHLIAAAPGLLEALEAVVHLRDLNDKFSASGNITIATLIDLCDEKISPLIAKAKGET